MHPEHWLEKWQADQIGFHQEQINAQLKYHFPILGLSRENPVEIFVPLCGKSLDMVWLAAQGHRVFGIELSPLAIEQFFESDPNPVIQEQNASFTIHRSEPFTLFCGDFFDLKPENLKNTRVVYDRASLVALPPEMRARYVAYLGKILPAGSQTLLLTLDYPEGEKNPPPFPVSDAEVFQLYTENGFHVELLESEDTTASQPADYPRRVSKLEERVYRIIKNG